MTPRFVSSTPVMRIVRPIGQLYRRLARSVVESTQDAEPKLFVFGVFGMVGYPLFYWIWAFLFPQPYESLGLRIAGMCLLAPSLLVKHWPKGLRRYIPAYWYLFILAGVPFFFSFMLLKNDVNAVWSSSFVTGILVVLFTFDLANALIMFFLGMILAVICYYISTSEPVPWNALLEQLPVLAFAVATVGVVSLEYAREKRAKIAAAMALGGHIGHELRTPLVTMRAAAEVIDEELTRRARAKPANDRSCAHLADPSEDGRILREAPAAIIREVDHAFMVIDLALANAGIRPFGANELRTIAILETVEAAIRRYPFKNLDQRRWIRIDSRETGRVAAVPALIDHVIFNLIKNGIYAIQAASRSDEAEIRIWGERTNHAYLVHFRDNGRGISAATVTRIFDPFFSTKPNGTGLGLHFCRTVMQRLGGDIRCRSVPDRFTEMVLEFPIPPGGDPHL